MRLALESLVVGVNGDGDHLSLLPFDEHILPDILSHVYPFVVTGA
jgi:flagellar basal body P-ring protein FlgI